MSRTPSCPWHRAAKQWHLLLCRVLVQNAVNLPVQKGQRILWLASGYLLKVNFFVLTGLCALFLLAYFSAPYFPFPENRLVNPSRSSKSQRKVNGNTTEDEDTHWRIVNTELDERIFLWIITYAAIFHFRDNWMMDQDLRDSQHWIAEVLQDLSSLHQPELHCRTPSWYTPTATPYSLTIYIRAATTFNSAIKPNFPNSQPLPNTIANGVLTLALDLKGKKPNQTRNTIAVNYE